MAQIAQAVTQFFSHRQRVRLHDSSLNNFGTMLKRSKATDEHLHVDGVQENCLSVTALVKVESILLLLVLLVLFWSLIKTLWSQNI